MIDMDRLSWALSVWEFFIVCANISCYCCLNLLLTCAPIEKYLWNCVLYCCILQFLACFWLTRLKWKWKWCFLATFDCFLCRKWFALLCLCFLVVVVVILLHVAKQINVAVCSCGALGASYRIERWVAFNGNHSENGTAKSRTAREQWRWQKTLRGGKNI